MDAPGHVSLLTETESGSLNEEKEEIYPLSIPTPVAAFPPYPPYAMPPAPPSIANAIVVGRELRQKHKSVHKKPAVPPPRPARPRGPKATDVKLSRRAMRRHARCLRCHGTALTDRLEHISKPQRRKILFLWREFAKTLPPETVARLRAMLDADEPFKPDQAYAYFFNLKRSKKKNPANARVNGMKKDILSLYSEKKFAWARNATVAFARGLQQRLTATGQYALGDGMLRLSNIILNEICSYMNMKTPSRRNKSPKAKFLIEMADKVAIWIDEILSESDDKMLMMDFDEDDDITGPGGAKFADDFLDMMGDGAAARKLLGPQPAYLKFKGPMLDAFNILTDSMHKKGNEQLLSHGKFQQTYSEGADELRLTPDLGGSDYNSMLADDINKKLTDVSKLDTPSDLEKYMTDIVDICSKHLSQNAEYNKDKGPAFKLLVENMKKKPDDELFQKDKITKTYGQAAKDLEQAKGLETDHEDPVLAKDIHTKLDTLMSGVTPNQLKTDMTDTLDLASKYMSEKAVDELERGPAFDILIKELERDGSEPFYETPALATQFAAAYTLKTAPGLTGVKPEPKTAPIFSQLLHDVVDVATPIPLKDDMGAVIERCANYLSAFDRDRDIATQKLLQMMKSKANETFATRPNYTMDYGTGAEETENAPSLLPYRPIKDVATEGKKNLTRDMEGSTPPDLLISMKALINDVSKHLSQPFALRSGIAGPRYGLEFLAAVKKSLGKKPLYKYKGYGQTYADAASTIKLGPLEATARPSAMELHETIESEIQKGVPVKLAPTIAQELKPTMGTAAKHLANVGTAKGKTLEHLVEMMKDKGEVPLAQLQGYDQTYDDGARRLENAPSLKRSQVELGAYEEVKKKLNKITKEKPAAFEERHAEHLPEIIDESSKYLSAPVPETDAEKRQVLADLMGRAGDNIIAEEASYKMTHKEGGKEIQKAKVGVTTAKDEKKKEAIKEKVEAVIPNQKMQELLKDPVHEGAAHLADTVKGRGGALEVVKEGLKKQKEKNLLAIGDFKKTHEQGAQMLTDAPHFEGKEPAPILKEVVHQRVHEAVPEAPPPHIEKKHMEVAKDIASTYIAGVATEESGIDPRTLRGMDAAALAEAESKGLGIESEAERLARLAREEAERLAAAERERLAKEEQEILKGPGEHDKEQLAAAQLLQKQLRSHGDEVFYEQPHATLTYKEAADCLEKPPPETEKKVKDSPDVTRLHKKFEKKLNAAVASVTPPELTDAMQDVVIDGAQQLSEKFVAQSLKAQAGVALISEMQKRGNEILVKVDGNTETTFFAAQRLKKAKELKTDKPCTEVAPHLNKKMDEIMKHHSMPRKLAPAVKEHTKVAADYLSPVVTKPNGGAELFVREADLHLTSLLPTKMKNDHIEAYVALLEEMEATGDTPLVQGDIPTSHKEAAHYLRHLTTFEDKIKRPNTSLKGDITKKLTNLMANVAPTGYTKANMSDVIDESAGLLTSYVMIQGEKTDALKEMVKQMDDAGNTLLLRHGSVRKSYKDGADLLRGKNIAELAVECPDPVVVRKLDLKVQTLMHAKMPTKYRAVIDGVIEDATKYLAVHLLEPQVIRVCKCMKNVLVQCELWCDEILRRVAKPPCTCSRHVSTQDVQDLESTPFIRICPGSSRAFAPGLEIAITQCPSRQITPAERCPAPKPTGGCTNHENFTTSYLLHSAVYNRNYVDNEYPTRLPAQSSSHMNSTISVESVPQTPNVSDTDRSSTVQNLIRDLHLQDVPYLDEPEHDQSNQIKSILLGSISNSSGAYRSRSKTRGRRSSPLRQPPSTYTKLFAQEIEYPTPFSSSLDVDITQSMFSKNTKIYSSRVPITTVSTDQMTDWHVMVVSLMWNVQAWRKWLQEIIDRGIAYQFDPNSTAEQIKDSWTSFQRRVASEALQWRQYNTFSRFLTMRLVSRYSNKVILSPTGFTVKTEIYNEIAQDMIRIIDMFYKWTQWLILVIKETSMIQQTSDTSIPLHARYWDRYKKNIIEYLDDWKKYTMYINVYWEQKYQIFITECAPNLLDSGPLWVVSACGAVPSGAVAAGIYDGEIVWIARTTHRGKVLPAALHPSKHCCLVYTDGAVFYYTKYQVLCNAEVNWVPWRGGTMGSRAVRVGEGVHIGRVHYRGSHLLGAVHAPQYRCHVVIYGRPFAFNCYELLFMTQTPPE